MDSPKGGLGTEPGVGNELEERCCCFPSCFGLENPAVSWLTELSRRGAPERASDLARSALPVPIPVVVRLSLAGCPGQLLRDPRDAPTFILLRWGSCPRAGWGIQQHSLSVQCEREQGKRLVNDLRREEIYVMCHFPPFSFLSSA